MSTTGRATGWRWLVGAGLATGLVTGCGSDGPPTTPGTTDDVVCCPIADDPSCDCTATGGTAGPGGTCGSVCDAANWTRTVDDNGCPMLVMGSGPESCMTPDARRDVDPDADGGPECCPIAEDPDCDCPPTGGSVDQPGGCHAECDVAQWRRETDPNGCPVLIAGPESCLDPRPDASGGGADSRDAPGPTDAAGDGGAPGDTDADGGGAGIQCGTAPSVFPRPDGTCEVDDDCVLVFHTTDCCGTEVAWGIAASQGAAFAEAEAICDSQYPGCGCAPQMTMADDGGTSYAQDDFTVGCDAGACRSARR